MAAVRGSLIHKCVPRIVPTALQVMSTDIVNDIVDSQILNFLAV